MDFKTGAETGVEYSKTRVLRQGRKMHLKQPPNAFRLAQAWTTYNNVFQIFAAVVITTPLIRPAPKSPLEELNMMEASLGMQGPFWACWRWSGHTDHCARKADLGSSRPGKNKLFLQFRLELELGLKLE